MTLENCSDAWAGTTSALSGRMEAQPVRPPSSPLRSPLHRALLLAVGGVVALSACTGVVGTSEGDGEGGPQTLIPLPAAAEAIGKSQARRLSRDEYDNAVEDLLGDTRRAGLKALPSDGNITFDNEYQVQAASTALIEGVETLAAEAAKSLVADASRLRTVLPCTPSGPDDAECMRAFVTGFGRRVLRRPLSAEETERLVALQALSVKRSDFNVGVRAVVQVLLQDPAFLYRVEVGTPVEGQNGVYRLGQFELASRLSFLILGSTPPEWLLDLAESAQLATQDDLASAAERLLTEPRAVARVQHFHAMWLGYADLPQHEPALAAKFQTEANALVKKVIFEQPSDYFGVFTSKEAYVDDALAQNYGMKGPGSSGFAWMPYSGPERAGILSTGAVLSNGFASGDSSPTRRGLFMRRRMLCNEVPAPPPTVVSDVPPEVGLAPCKAERYAEHANNPTCIGCHTLMDPIGFGLEAFDISGRFRTTEPDEPSCSIKGEGEVAGSAKFTGPAGFAKVLTESGRLEACVATQYFRFASGRREDSSERDNIQALANGFQSGERQFGNLVMGLVSQDTFAFRRDP